jgi:hypothetical protein
MCYAWCLQKCEPNINECIQCFYVNSFILILYLTFTNGKKNSHIGLKFRNLLQINSQTLQRFVDVT